MQADSRGFWGLWLTDRHIPVSGVNHSVSEGTCGLWHVPVCVLAPQKAGVSPTTVAKGCGREGLLALTQDHLDRDTWQHLETTWDAASWKEGISRHYWVPRKAQQGSPVPNCLMPRARNLVQTKQPQVLLWGHTGRSGQVASSS